MDNGLEMTKAQFMRLPRKERDGCIYDNILEIKKLTKGYKFHYRLNNIIGGGLITGLGALFYIVLEHITK